MLMPCILAAFWNLVAVCPDHLDSFALSCPSTDFSLFSQDTMSCHSIFVSALILSCSPDIPFFPGQKVHFWCCCGAPTKKFICWPSPPSTFQYFSVICCPWRIWFLWNWLAVDTVQPETHLSISLPTPLPIHTLLVLTRFSVNLSFRMWSSDTANPLQRCFCLCTS